MNPTNIKKTKGKKSLQVVSGWEDERKVHYWVDLQESQTSLGEGLKIKRIARREQK